MNKDKVKKFIYENLEIDMSAYREDGRIKAFECVIIYVYPQSFGRLDIIISSKYGYASGSGITRYSQVWDIINKFEDCALNNFYADYWRNHSKKGGK